jgi:hypothetical protein
MRRVFAGLFTMGALVTGLLLPAGSAQAATLNVCAGQVPSGYILTNNYWSPSTCGNPATVVYNVWVVTSYSDKPVNFTLNVCDAARVPSGWVVQSGYWSPSTCLPAPADPNFHNVKTIRRTS